jgi:hypothetical protein
MLRVVRAIVNYKVKIPVYVLYLQHLLKIGSVALITIEGFCGLDKTTNNMRNELYWY